MTQGTAKDYADLLAEVYVGENALEQALGVTDARTEALEIGAWVVTHLQAHTNPWLQSRLQPGATRLAGT